MGQWPSLLLEIALNLALTRALIIDVLSQFQKIIELLKVELLATTVTFFLQSCKTGISFIPVVWYKTHCNCGGTVACSGYMSLLITL